DYGNRSNAISFGELRVVVGIDDLQIPEAEKQESHQRDDEVRNEGQPRLRETIFALKPDRHTNSQPSVRSRPIFQFEPGEAAFSTAPRRPDSLQRQKQGPTTKRRPQ